MEKYYKYYIIISLNVNLLLNISSRRVISQPVLMLNRILLYGGYISDREAA